MGAQRSPAERDPLHPLHQFLNTYIKTLVFKSNVHHILLKSGSCLLQCLPTCTVLRHEQRFVQNRLGDHAHPLHSHSIDLHVRPRENISAQQSVNEEPVAKSHTTWLQSGGWPRLNGTQMWNHKTSLNTYTCHICLTRV